MNENLSEHRNDHVPDTADAITVECKGGAIAPTLFEKIRQFNPRIKKKPDPIARLCRRSLAALVVLFLAGFIAYSAGALDWLSAPSEDLPPMLEGVRWDPTWGDDW